MRHIEIKFEYLKDITLFTISAVDFWYLIVLCGIESTQFTIM